MTLSAEKMQIHVLLAKNRELLDDLILFRNRSEDLSKKLSQANEYLEKLHSARSRGKYQFNKRICDEDIDHAEDQTNMIYVNEVVTKLFQ